MPYRNATICINGHVIHKFESNHQPYCSLCGAKTISYCPNCNAPIHGVWENPNIISLQKL